MSLSVQDEFRLFLKQQYDCITIKLIKIFFYEKIRYSFYRIIGGNGDEVDGYGGIESKPILNNKKFPFIVYILYI